MLTAVSSALTIADLDLPRMRDEMLARGWRTGRSDALLRVLYSGEPVDPVRYGGPVAAWANALPPSPSRVVSRHASLDGTTKLLVSCGAGAADTVECVLMAGEKPGEFAGCVSSQIGCAMGCDFCASTLEGVKRDLSAAEIVGQFLHLRAEATARGARLNTIVFMGMGEPMLNLDAVLPAIHRMGDPSCGALGYKNIQVSTVGIVPGIERLRDSGLRVQLALSLHGPDDETRRRVVPAGKKYTVAATLDAAWAFQLATGRISNIEYCLLAGENDSPDHARKLAEALGGRRMHVNLIPHNPIGTGLSGKQYARPTPEAVRAFLAALRDAGVAAHVRKTRGDDASAACGQLRRTVSLALAP